MILSFHGEKQYIQYCPNRLESPGKRASICLICTRICITLENWDVSSDYEFSLQLLSTLSLSFPKIHQKQHQKLCWKQQQNILTWPTRAFKPWAQLFFHRPHWHTSRSPITHNIRALSTFPFNPMRFSLLVSQTCACPPRWQSRS